MGYYKGLLKNYRRNKMNKCIFVGRLTKDPEEKVYNEYSFMNITIAIDRPYKNKAGEKLADFLNFKFGFPKSVNFIRKYVQKGQQVSIVASLENNNYEKDGKKVYSNQLNGQEISIVQSMKKEEKSEGLQDLELVESDTPF